MVTESNILNSIGDYLSLRKHFFFRCNNIPVYNVAAQAWRSMPKHSMKGVPDLIVVTDGGYVVFLEVKKKGGSQSKDQKIFQERCKEKGAEYYLVKSIDDVKEVGL